MIRGPGNTNSFNLFGIKADARWNGERAPVTTVEYREGIAVRERAAFRAYDSFESAVSDYVNFIRGNPRYQGALQQAGNPAGYLRGLQDAGYATDPAYADKVRTLMDQIVAGPVSST